MFNATGYINKYRVCQLENSDRRMFGDMFLAYQTIPSEKTTMNCNDVKSYKIVQNVRHKRTKSEEYYYGERNETPDDKKRRASMLMDQLLIDIYGTSINNYTDYNSATSSRSQMIFVYEKYELERKNRMELLVLITNLNGHVYDVGKILVRQLKRRDALRRQTETQCDVITKQLRKLMSGLLNAFKKASMSTVNSQKLPTGYTGNDMHFSLEPGPGDSGFNQWHSAMKMVAQLPEGIPPEFRRRLWLTLADKHLLSKNIDWKLVEKNCFSEWSHPDDSELGVQIVKDLHRTGCSLFCGEDGQENQALLKKVLLAYARWNKAVGYCQGFNMLAALILQVTDKCESDALKLMIYLIEGVLPDSYFADSLRGLSVDMAVFRELLRSKLPRLSRHLDALQTAAKEGTTSYEPPLTNVFTMQWFLTLFCNCLPQPTVLRVWDLILLEGNEILLRTALAIWQALADRILSVRSADEFYSIMGVLTREMLEFGILDANSLIKSVVTIGPLDQLKSLREHYLYNINPWNTSSSSSSSIKSTRDRCENVNNKQIKLYSKEKLVLDIGVLKKQYAKLKQRQRQAHIIFNAAVTRQPSSNIVTPVAVNHLLLGKSALLTSRRLGPPKGSIPPARTIKYNQKIVDRPKSPPSSSSSSSSDTELCDDPDNNSMNDSDIEEIEDPLKKDLQSFDNLEKSAEPKSEPQPILLDFDDTTTRKIFDNNAKLHEIPCSSSSNSTRSNTMEIVDVEPRSESVESDDTFDFERFLEERIQCLKDRNNDDEIMEENRLQCGRKNSERALQIMQENSLILHRILQCQSKPTPFVEETPSISNENADINDDKLTFDTTPLNKDSITFDEALNVDSITIDEALDKTKSFERTETSFECRQTSPTIDDHNSTMNIEDNNKEHLIDFHSITDVTSCAPDPLPLFKEETAAIETKIEKELDAAIVDKSIDELSLDHLLEDNIEAMKKSFQESAKKDEDTSTEHVPLSNVQERLLAVESNIKEAGDYLKQYRDKMDMKNLEGPPIESKYEKILNYSKDLDDRYKNLILNQNNELIQTSVEIVTSTEEEIVCSTRKNEVNLNLDIDKIDMTDDVKLNDVEIDSDNCLNKDQEDAFLIKNDTIEKDYNNTCYLLESTQKLSPNQFVGECSTNNVIKSSPNKSLTFNPFPIDVSQRQNKKDVALKLGLYNNKINK